MSSLVQTPWVADGLPADTLFFYSHGRGDPDYGDLSNFGESVFWAPHPLRESVMVCFGTNEHHFNAHKTLNADDFDWIVAASTPMQAKRRGSRRGERGRRIMLRPDWQHRHRYHVMLAGLRLKFALPGPRALLLSTGERHLAEDSPRDFEWGCRDRRGGWTGLNLL
jgi:ribA/ribD-fused uncharacterized protein